MSVFSLLTKSANTFEGQETGESTILLLRRHPLVAMMPVLFLLIVGLTSFSLLAVIWTRVNNLGYGNVLVFAGAIWYLALWLAAFYSLTMYTLNVGIITDLRVVENSQQGLFNRSVAELHLERVQDISVTSAGLMATVFHYGDLEIQTAGAEIKFHFKQIPHPEKIKDLILDLVTQRQQEWHDPNAQV